VTKFLWSIVRLLLWCWVGAVHNSQGVRGTDANTYPNDASQGKPKKSNNKMRTRDLALTLGEKVEKGKGMSERSGEE
jgi:hypothetical protein